MATTATAPAERPAMSAALGFFFRVGLYVEGAAAVGAAAGADVGGCAWEDKPATLKRGLEGADAGASGAAGTTKSVWQDGQLIC